MYKQKNSNFQKQKNNSLHKKIIKEVLILNKIMIVSHK